MNRREFFKSAAAFAAVGAMGGRGFFAGTQGANRNNPIWLMTSAFPGETFDDVMARAKSVGAQGLELCVFRRDSDRTDHTATHLDYDHFDLEAAKRVVAKCNEMGLRVSVGAYDNLIGGDPAQQIKNRNHILKLIRIAALLGGDENDVVCGSFVGYDHVLGRTDRGFEKNLEKFNKDVDSIDKKMTEVASVAGTGHKHVMVWHPAWQYLLQQYADRFGIDIHMVSVEANGEVTPSQAVSMIKDEGCKSIFVSTTDEGYEGRSTLEDAGIEVHVVSPTSDDMLESISELLDFLEEDFKKA